MAKPEQQTREWLDWRREGIGASDAAVIMGVSPWKTAYELWAEKIGLAESTPANQAMRRGIDLEPEARKSYEQKAGHIMEPHLQEHPQLSWMRASLDGINLDGSLILEIKCPGEQDHADAKKGKVPDKYYPQLQHQLAVTGASLLHYWSFDGHEGVLIEVHRDNEYINKLIAAEADFWELICKRVPPPMTDRDLVERTDAEWLAAAAKYRSLSRIADEATNAAEAARKELIRLAEDHSCSGHGVRLVKYFKSGNVDYKSIPELKGVDLEKYRKKGSMQWRITLESED